jgi:pimeloyl-ACP methyl ester carboxylesterase
MVPAVRCPTLVIHGDQDALCPYRDGRALARMTGGRLETIRGSGHNAQARWPVQVNLALREFLAPVTREREARPLAEVAG